MVYGILDPGFPFIAIYPESKIQIKRVIRSNQGYAEEFNEIKSRICQGVFITT